MHQANVRKKTILVDPRWPAVKTFSLVYVYRLKDVTLYNVLRMIYQGQYIS